MYSEFFDVWRSIYHNVIDDMSTQSTLTIIDFVRHLHQNTKGNVIIVLLINARNYVKLLGVFIRIFVFVLRDY